MARVDAFFDLFKARFGHSRYEEMKAVWDESQIYEKCSAVVKSGKRKDELCGKGCVAGKHYCLCHIPQDTENTEKKVCGKELITGKNKGKTCNRLCVEGEDRCSNHVHKTIYKNASEKTCVFMLTRGPRKDEQCGSQCVKDTDYCKRHTEEQVQESNTDSKDTYKLKLNFGLIEQGEQSEVKVNELSKEALEQFSHSIKETFVNMVLESCGVHINVKKIQFNKPSYITMKGTVTVEPSNLIKSIETISKDLNKIKFGPNHDTYVFDNGCEYKFNSITLDK